MRTSISRVTTAADHRVGVLVLDGAKALDVGIAAHVFAKRSSMPYEVRVCGEHPGTVDGWNGLAYAVSHGLETLDWADTIFVPGYRNPADTTTSPEVLEALRNAYARGTRIAAISTGAFTLAAAGLLDGRRATTHWHYTHVMRDRYPEINVDENVLFVDAGQVLTSAGAASGIDLCLHLIRRDHGVGLANHVGRRLVSAPYRTGGQAQYAPTASPNPSATPSHAPEPGRLNISAPTSPSPLSRSTPMSPRARSHDDSRRIPASPQCNGSSELESTTPESCSNAPTSRSLRSPRRPASDPIRTSADTSATSSEPLRPPTATPSRNSPQREYSDLGVYGGEQTRGSRLRYVVAAVDRARLLPRS